MNRPQNVTRREALAISSLGMLALGGESLLRANESIPAGKLQVQRVLFLGNSITLHGPAPQIGWTGNYGMAASREELDYVHVLLKKIRQHTASEPKSIVKNIAEFERGLDGYPIADKLQPELEFGADLVIVAIGENVAALANEDAKSRYAKAFAALLTEIKRHGPSTILIRSCFWADSAKDGVMQQACQDAQCVWVDMSDLGGDEKNFARSERQIEHAGVAGHPGDCGMQAIADRLWKSITLQSSLWK